MNQAIFDRNNAYISYLKFKVGAALLLNNKCIVTRNNQENATYPSNMYAK